MAGKLTKAQRVARTVINFLVERYFQNGLFFYGNGPLLSFDKMDGSRKLPMGSMAAMSLARMAMDSGRTKITVDVGGMTVNEADMGDWRITVEAISLVPAALRNHEEGQ